MSEWTDVINGKDYAVCAEWESDHYWGPTLSSLVTLLTILINIIIRVIMSKLITWVGSRTESAKFRGIMIGVFIMQFSNTAILLILINANISESQLPIPFL
jgi:hypothetical protein